MRLGPLRNAYSQRELRAELRATMKELKRADRQESVLYPGHYDIAVPDKVTVRGKISQELPMMFGPTLLDARIAPGVWEDRFFAVIRPNDHQILIREASFSPVAARVEEVVIAAGQQSPSYVNFDQGPTRALGTYWGWEPLAELDSTPEARAQAQERVAEMVARARSVVGEENWGFRPLTLWDPSHDTSRSPL